LFKHSNFVQHFTGVQHHHHTHCDNPDTKQMSENTSFIKEEYSGKAVSEVLYLVS